MRSLLLALALAPVALAGCDTTPGTGSGTALCQPGFTAACTCPDGTPSTRTCQDNGVFAACACAGVIDGAGSDADPPDGGPHVSSDADAGPKAEVVDPDVVQPDVVEPDVVEPDVVEPDVVEPDVVEPDVVEPDVVEPDAPEPDVPVTPTATTIEALQSSATSTGCPEGALIETHQENILVEGVVVASPRYDAFVNTDDPSKDLHGYFVASGSGAEKGIVLVLSATAETNFAVGTRLDVTGDYKEYYCLSEIAATSWEETGTGAAPSPTTISAGLFDGGVEPYEGTLVTVEDLSVTTTTNSFGETETAQGVLIDSDLYDYTLLQAGTEIGALTGFVSYGFGQYRLLPTSAGDFVGVVPPTSSGTTIAALQTSSASTSCANPDAEALIDGPLELEGVTVVSEKAPLSASVDGYFVAEAPGGANHGLWVIVPDSLGTNFSPGDTVDLVGEHTEYYCLTELIASQATLVGTADWSYEVTAEFPTPSAFMDGSDPEDYEGSLVSILQGCVTDTSSYDQYGQFALEAGLLVDDTLYALPSAPLVAACGPVTGFVTYSFGAYRLLPRDASDVGL